MRKATTIFKQAEEQLAIYFRHHPQGPYKISVRDFERYVACVGAELAVNEFPDPTYTQERDVLNECIKGYLEKVGDYVAVQVMTEKRPSIERSNK